MIKEAISTPTRIWWAEALFLAILLYNTIHTLTSFWSCFCHHQRLVPVFDFQNQTLKSKPNVHAIRLNSTRFLLLLFLSPSPPFFISRPPSSLPSFSYLFLCPLIKDWNFVCFWGAHFDLGWICCSFFVLRWELKDFLKNWREMGVDRWFSWELNGVKPMSTSATMVCLVVLLLFHPSLLLPCSSLNSEGVYSAPMSNCSSSCC